MFIRPYLFYIMIKFNVLTSILCTISFYRVYLFTLYYCHMLHTLFLIVMNDLVKRTLRFGEV